MSQNDYYNKDNKSGGGGGFSNGSPFGGSGGGSPNNFKKTEAQQSLRPMTIAQLYRASQAHTDADWQLDDGVIGSVTVVAHVSDISPQPTNTSYTISDGTGTFEARHWNEQSSAEDTGRWSGLQSQSYVRIVGNLKEFNTKRYINALNIRPIDDPMEIYFHILETIAFTLQIEHGAPPSGQAPVPATGNNGRQAPPVASGSTSAYQSSSSSTKANNAKWAKLPKHQLDILHYMLAAPPQKEGIHVGDIARAVGGDAETISAALDSLMDDGHIFSTIDDSHFKVSD